MAAGIAQGRGKAGGLGPGAGQLGGFDRATLNRYQNLMMHIRDLKRLKELEKIKL